MTAYTPERRKISARALAELHGVSPRTVRRAIAEPRADYLARAQARRLEIIDLRAQGKTWADVATHFGISVAAAKQAGFDARKALAAETSGN